MIIYIYGEKTLNVPAVTDRAGVAFTASKVNP